MVSIYSSNLDEVQNGNNQDNSLTNQAINMMDTYFDSVTGEKFLQDYENIITNLLKISNSKLDKENLKLILKILNSIIKNIDPILSDLDKLNNLYHVLDNIQIKCSDLMSKIFYLFL